MNDVTKLNFPTSGRKTGALFEDGILYCTRFPDFDAQYMPDWDTGVPYSLDEEEFRLRNPLMFPQYYDDSPEEEFGKDFTMALVPWPNPQAWFTDERTCPWKVAKTRPDILFQRWITPASNEDGQNHKKNRHGGSLPNGQLMMQSIMKEVDNSYRFIARINESDVREMNRYFDMIPPDIRNALCGYPYLRWNLLRLFAASPAVIDLHHSNPSLLLALASRVDAALPELGILLKKKQRNILEWLGWKSSENSCTILKKIHPGCWGNHLYPRSLRICTYDADALKCLSHVQHINRNVLELLTQTESVIRKMLSIRLITDVSELGDEYRIREQSPYELLLETIDMARDVRWHRIPQTFTSWERLCAIHDDLSRRLNRNQSPDKTRAISSVFPEPPFFGTESIKPITTYDALQQEGYFMKNCVAGYAGLITEGLSYIYRAFNPIRATLSIHYANKQESGERPLNSQSRQTLHAESPYQWYPDEARGYCNSEISGEVKEKLFDALFTSLPGVRAHATPEIEPLAEQDVRQLPLMTPKQYNLFRECHAAFNS